MKFSSTSILASLLLAATTTGTALGQTQLIPPWNKTSLQEVLSECRLQEPESSPAAVSGGNFEGYATEKFQLVNNEMQQYQNRTDGKRNELRHNTYFNVADWFHIKARLTLPYPEQFNIEDWEYGNRHFVIFQSHVKDYLGYKAGPLITFRYYAVRNDIFNVTKYDHIWANVRNELSTDIKTNTYWDAGPRPDGPFDIEIEFFDTKLWIRVNGVLIPFFPKDMTYWTEIEQNYFKSGIYLTKWNTSVVVSFDELHMGEHPNATQAPTVSPAPTGTPTIPPLGVRTKHASAHARARTLLDFSSYSFTHLHPFSSYPFHLHRTFPSNLIPPMSARLMRKAA